MKILAASVTNRGPDILGPHLEAMQALVLPSKVTLDLAYISDHAPEGSLRLLHEAGVRVSEANPKPGDATYAVTEATHEWNVSTFEWLAFEKQRLLDLAVEEGYDAVFFVDSDLVLGPETLASLVTSNKPVCSAVFWTRWQPGAPPMPQVWLRHPYEMEGRSGSRHLTPPAFLRALDERALIEVGGLGACTLIKTDVLNVCRFHPLLPGLPEGGMWQGEDRSFCIRATRAHVELWADAWPDIHHLYRPSDTVATWLHPTRKTQAELGDLISCTLETLEEVEVVRMKRREHLRGRVGALRVLPEIEDAMLTTPVGEERIVRVTFPMWWSLEAYRGHVRSVLLRVLDVKG